MRRWRPRTRTRPHQNEATKKPDLIGSARREREEERGRPVNILGVLLHTIAISRLSRVRTELSGLETHLSIQSGCRLRLRQSRKKGQQPYWSTAGMKDHVRPAAKRAGITKRIGSHTLRHTFGTLVKSQRCGRGHDEGTDAPSQRQHHNGPIRPGNW
jgi:integrase